MRDAVRWLRISYRVGAVVDLAAAAQMLHPPLFAWGMGLSGFDPGIEYRYAMAMGASLMLGWTAILLWADRQPLARSGVLPLTVFPVIAGIVADEVWGVRSGFLPVAAVLPIWVLQAVLVVLFLASYWQARRPSAAGKDATEAAA